MAARLASLRSASRLLNHVELSLRVSLQRDMRSGLLSCDQMALQGSKAPLEIMKNEFRSHGEMNPANRAILSRWKSLDLPGSWLVAGCLFQTVWNLQAGRLPDAGIKDYDIFYFDPHDLSESAEAQVQAHTEFLLGDLGVTVEVANQARVHLWYPQYFGQPCPMLTSSEDGIGRFLVLETCVA